MSPGLYGLLGSCSIDVGYLFATVCERDFAGNRPVRRAGRVTGTYTYGALGEFEASSLGVF